MRVVHISQGCKKGDFGTLQVRKRIGERMLARPAHTCKRFRQPRTAPQSHEPVTAVFCGAENGVVPAHQTKRLCKMGRPDAGNIRTDNGNWPRRQSLHDALTGLPNRVLFNEALAEALRVAQEKGRRLTLLYIDLDRFREINDTFGYRWGDVILQQVAGPGVTSERRPICGTRSTLARTSALSSRPSTSR